MGVRIPSRWTCRVRRGAALALVGVLIMPAIPLPARLASAVGFPAVPPAPAFATGMEIEDGNKPVNGAAPAFDWNTIQSATPPGPYSGPNINSAGIVDTSFAVDVNGAGMVCDGNDTTANPVSQFPDDNGATVPASGSNFNGWQIGPVSNLSDASDLCTGAAALELAQVYGVGYDQTHYVLYQYVTRHPEATGSIVFFTVLQGPAAGRCDDYLLKFDFNPSGSSANVSTLSWAPDAGDCTNIYGAGSWQPTAAPAAAVAYATGTNRDPLDNGDPLDPNAVTFAETSVDLGLLGLIPDDECVTFTASGVFTQSGNNGQLQDFLSYADPIAISNCNSLTVTKATEPAGISSSANFGYRVHQGDDRPVHDATLTPNGLDADASVDSITATIQAGQSHTWGNVIAAPDYFVEELTPLPAGWTLATIECTYTDLLGTGTGTPNGDGTKTVTIYANGAYTGENFDISPAQLAAGPSCTITNQTSGITIVKDSEPDGATDFAFTASAGMTPANFLLDDDADPTRPNSQSYVGLAPGSYTVTEGATAGWDLTGLECAGQTDSTISTDVATGAVTVGLAASEFVTCTFTNTERGSITIVKDAVPGTDATVFDYTASGLTPSSFTLTDDGNAGADTQTFSDLVPGAYSVTELTETGWTLGGIVCTDPTGGTTTNGATASIDLGPGDDVVCTYTNDLNMAQITLTKAWGAGPAGDAVSLSAAGSSGQFPDAVGANSNDGVANDADAVLTVRGGETVSLAELFGPGNPANYTTSLSCTDASGLAYTPGALTATYTVPAEPVDVTCTFTNTRRTAPLTLQKVWVDAATGDTAELSLDGLNDDSALSTAPAAPGATNIATITVYAGETVAMSETLPGANTGSYDTTLACGQQQIGTTTSGVYTVPANPQAITCTFTNTRQRSTLTLHKAWVDAAAGDTALLTLAGTQGSPSDTSVAVGAVGTQDDTGNTVTLTVLSGEVATATESITGVGSYGTTLTCSGPGTLSYLGGQSGTVTAPKQPNGQIDCVFTNTAGRGTIIIDKHVAGADRAFTFNGTWAGGAAFDVATTGGSGQQVFGGVLAGSYSVTESVPAGYALTGLACVETSSAPDQGDATGVDGTTGVIDLDAGETVRCTFTNAERGPLTVTKTVTSGPTLVSGTTHRVTYELVVTSASYIDETFNLSDTLDFGGGIAVVSATSSPAVPGWTGVAPNTALVTGGTIPAQGTITYTITVDADIAGSTAADGRDCVQDDGEGTGFLNRAQITWDGGSDDAEACAPIPPEADVAVVKTANPTSVTINQDQSAPQVGWSIVVTNNGPVEAVGVTLDDNVPSVFIGVSATTPTGSCAVTGQAVHCDLGTMASGASITVTITAIVAAGTPAGTYTNTALVGSSSPPDPNPANNSDSADTDVSVVAVQPPPPPTTPPVPPTPPAPTVPATPPVPQLLPATGGNTVNVQYLGALVIGLGLLAVAVTRRRRDRSAQA
jgi:hypothetical protein